MEGSILNDLGFDPVYLLIASAILTLILMVVTILCLINMRKLYRRYDLFMRGKDAESMENMIVDQMNANIELKSQDRYNKDSIRTANKNSRAAFQKIGIVKYNAFKGMGGNLSFALAMLDYTNTGFVLNSVHSREGCYLYLRMWNVVKQRFCLVRRRRKHWSRLLVTRRESQRYKAKNQN